MTPRQITLIAQEIANLKRRLADKIDEPIDAVCYMQDNLSLILKDNYKWVDEDSFRDKCKIINSNV